MDTVKRVSEGGRLKAVFYLLLCSLNISCGHQIPLEGVGDSELGFDQNFANHDMSHGKQLALLMCGGCHFNASDQAFSGKRLSDLPAYVGKVYSADLTRGSATMSRYNTARLKRLIRTGVKANGKVSRFMGVPQISDLDLKALVDYLGSEDLLLEGRGQQVAKSRYSLLSKIYFLLNPIKALYAQPDSIAALTGATAQRGEYLVSLFECYGCHSRSIASINKQTPVNTPGYMAGGASLIDERGRAIRSANLTPDLKSGIGGWQLEDLRRALIDGVRPDGQSLRGPMPRYRYLRPEEIESIYLYLQGLRSVPNLIRRTP